MHGAYRKMAKKRPQKKRRKIQATSIALLPINELPNSGRHYLDQEKFAEAIKIFRRLLQESKDEQWAEPLCSSFLGRINQLAGKGMHKEALVIFHNMENQLPDQTRKLQGQHILLLMHAGELAKAQQLYETTKDTLGRDQKQRVEEAFATLLLSGNKGLGEGFPPDSPLGSQFVHAQKALRCYAQGQDSEALESLQYIPFRSPYRNFLMALKGMLAFHERQDKARSFFDKVDTDSPFFALITPYCHLLEYEKGGEKEQRELGKKEKNV